VGWRSSQPLHRYLRQLPGIMRRDRNYARFLLGRTTMQLGAMATGFFIVYGRDRFQIDGAGVGLIASHAVMNPIWGLIGDRRGYKVVLVSAAWLTALTALSAWLAQTQTWLIVTFMLLGVAQAADGVAALNIILEFCAPADRPTYIGLTNTLLAPTLTLAPLIGGWLAVSAGYRGLFLTALIIAALGGVLLAFLVQEPRTSPRPSEEYARV
jgi:MFS family permease